MWVVRDRAMFFGTDPSKGWVEHSTSLDYSLVRLCKLQEPLLVGRYYAGALSSLARQVVFADEFRLAYAIGTRGCDGPYLYSGITDQGRGVIPLMQKFDGKL